MAKILYGITKSNFGGAQRYVYELAVEAKKRGHDTAVLCGGTGVLVNKLGEAGIRVISLGDMQRDINISKEVSSGIELIKILKREKPDVFHINSSKMGGTGALAARIARVKNIIFTSHGWAFNEPRSWWQKLLIKFFVWVTLLLCHKTICVSEKTCEQVAEGLFIKNKLSVVYNGITEFDLTERINAREKLGIIADETLVVGTLAELHKIKGLDVLLRAWSKFIHKHSAKLIIMGTGEERENLQNMASNLGISESVEFKGFVDNARSMIRAFDIFVLPSRSENLPYVILEAGLASRPVIATSVGGIPEIIKNGTSGVLVHKEDPEELFSSLVLLSQDEELRERLGRELKEVVTQKFSFNKMVEETFALYK